MTNGESQYKTTTLGGRDIQVTLPTDGQFALLTLQVRNVRRATTDPGMALMAMGGIMAIIEKIIHEDDREYVSDQLLEGNIGTTDLLELLGVFSGEEEVIDVKPARATRRSTAKR